MAGKQLQLEYEPQERQALLHSTPARLVLYGGAVGGGKSHAIRWDLIRWCLNVPGIRCYLFRRTLGELEDNHISRIRQELPPEVGTYTENRKIYEFANGSQIRFCYCEKEKDVERYQGAEIHVLGVDEAGHLTDYQLNYLIGRNRLGGFQVHVPEEYRHALPRAVFGSNPGGPGHSFLKTTFIEPAPPETLFWQRRYRNPKDPEDKGILAIYIPAKMRDNAFIDAGYEGNLAGLPPELQRAYMDGDWDAVVGQALHTLSRDLHGLRPFTPPRHWTHIMSIDWGSAKPFSVGWYVVVPEWTELAAKDGYPARFLPPGAVIRFKEWYGWAGRPDHGMRADARTVARRIIEMEKEAGMPPMDYRVGDSAMWNRMDGPSTQENMADATDGRLLMTPSRKSREHNYSEFLCRLAGNVNYRVDGKFGDQPMFFCTLDCRHFWRTVPILTLDTTDPEKGPDTDLEDHCLAGDTIIGVRSSTTGRRGCVRMDAIPEQADEVFTQEGWKPFVNLGCTNPEANLFRVELVDGTWFDATGNHPVLTTENGYRRVDELTYNSHIVCVDTFWRHRWRSISTARRIGSVGITGRDAVNACIGLFGSITTGLSRKASTFITRIMTATTTTSPIWSCCLPRGTSVITRTPMRRANISGGTSNVSGPPQRSGMDRTTAFGGTLSKASETELCRRVLSLYVRNAAKRVWPRHASANTAPGDANSGPFGVKIRAITPIGTGPVYNLHVPGPNSFVVNGGAVVHNCYDEIAYLLRSRPYMTTEKDRYMAIHGEEIRKARRGTQNADPYATA